MNEDQKSYKDLPIGGVILDAGNSEKYNTGTWRSFRPIHHKEKCTNCLLCWMFCPDSSVIIVDEKFDHFDYDHCKGCGICAFECPAKEKAIVMENEDNFR